MQKEIKTLHIFPLMLAHVSPAIQSHPVLLVSIRITPHPQVCDRGYVRHHVSPCRTAFSCPSIMSAGDIQAWCDVAFSKGHVRLLCSICISRTGSRHMGAGIGHYPGPQGDLMLCGFVSGILISLFQYRAQPSHIKHWCRATEMWFWPSVIQREAAKWHVFCFTWWTLLSCDALIVWKT